MARAFQDVEELATSIAQGVSSGCQYLLKRATGAVVPKKAYSRGEMVKSSSNTMDGFDEFSSLRSVPQRENEEKLWSHRSHPPEPIIKSNDTAPKLTWTQSGRTVVTGPCD